MLNSVLLGVSRPYRITYRIRPLAFYRINQPPLSFRSFNMSAPDAKLHKDDVTGEMVSKRYVGALNRCSRF